MSEPESKRYHHGNLRQALIEAGLRIVEENGVDAVSLRAVARRVEVSHSAPYHHFSTKAELLAAMAASGFERLVEEIQTEIAANPHAQPIDQLRAVGRAYMRFAASNPSSFRLMFRPELTQPSLHPVLQNAEAQAFGALMQVIIGCQEQDQLPRQDPFLLALCAWSSVHGLSTLKVEQLLHETPLGGYDWLALMQTINEFVISGLTARETSAREISVLTAKLPGGDVVG